MSTLNEKNTRLCSKCSMPHGMVLENTEDSTIQEIDLCYDCLFYGCKIEYKPLDEQISFEKETE